jgi:hypothetical protein
MTCSLQRTLGDEQEEIIEISSPLLSNFLPYSAVPIYYLSFKTMNGSSVCPVPYYSGIIRSIHSTENMAAAELQYLFSHTSWFLVDQLV